MLLQLKVKSFPAKFLLFDEWSGLQMFFAVKPKQKAPAQNGQVLTTCKINNLYYSASATTSFTSGIILFIIPSMPDFNVIIEEGHPLQLPCSIRFTVPSL